MRRRFGYAFLAVSLGAAALFTGRRPLDLGSPAGACSCANAQAPWLVPYGGKVVRPRNARLRFLPIWQLANYKDWARDNGFDGTKWNFVMKRQGDDKLVPLEQRVVGEAQQATLELWPKTPLAPNATYVIERAGGPERSPQGWPKTRAELTTSDAIDTKAPEWSGVKAARFLREGLADETSCNVRAPLIELDVSDVKDDTAAASDIQLEIFRPTASGGFDYAAPPVAMVMLHKGRAYLGRTGLCSEAEFNVRPLERVRIAVRAVDLAGNASTPSEITIDPRTGWGSTATSPELNPAAPKPANEGSPAPAPRSRFGCSR